MCRVGDLPARVDPSAALRKSLLFLATAFASLNSRQLGRRNGTRSDGRDGTPRLGWGVVVVVGVLELLLEALQRRQQEQQELSVKRSSSSLDGMQSVLTLFPPCALGFVASVENFFFGF